jgi:alkylated DNA repair dioxygenase AlkB
MPQQPLLFSAERTIPLSHGGQLWYSPNFLNTNEAKKYYAEFIETVPWEVYPGPFGHPMPRLISWIADEPYSYSRTTNPPRKWTPTLTMLRKRVESFMHGSSEGQFQSVLLNYYRNGQDSVAYHSDDEEIMKRGSPIASISLGAERRFLVKPVCRCQPKHETIKLVLEHGSLLVMSGAIQKFWQHSIPKTKNLPDGRINLTFRQHA